MKHEVQLEKKRKEVYLSELENTDHVGYVDDLGNKWQVVLATDGLNAICHNHKTYSEGYQLSRSTNRPDMQDLLGFFCDLKAVYKFDNRNELYQWLAE